MKKYIKIAAIALVAVLASCSSDDETIDFSESGGNAVPQASISRLDTNFDLPIALFTKEGVTATKVEIYQNIAATTADPVKLGPKVADATIAGNKATFNTSTLGSFDVFPVTANGVTTNTGKTGVFVLAIITTYSDGTTTKAPYRLTVAKGIVWKADDHGTATTTTTTTSGVTAVLYEDPTPAFIHYATVTNAGTVVTSVVGSWSKNGGAFTPFADTFSTTKQSIDVANIPYSTYGGLVAGDKITYRFVVTSSTGQQDTISTTVTFADQLYDAAKDGVLSNSDTTSQFSFATGLNYVGADATNPEVTFTQGFGFKRSSNNVRIQFVLSTLDFEDSNLFDAQTAFDNGTPLAAVTNLHVDDVILYKVTRNVNLGTADKPNFQDVTYFGLIQITDRIAGTTSQQLKFSYKEGVLNLEEPTTPVVIIPAP